MFADNKLQEGFAYLAEMARSASGRGIAADMWFSEVKSMPVSKASVQALQQFLLQFPTGSVAANARVLLDQQQAQLQDPTFRARSEGLAAVKSGNTTQAVADLQKAVQADSRDSDAVGALGQAYSQRGDRARAVAQLSKAIAMDPDSPNRGKWDSLLQTNRYWLLIKQGDNALKAGQLSQAQNYYAQAQRVDRTDSYAVLGLGMSRRRAKRRRRSAITSRRCAWIAAITWRCAAWPTSIAPNRRRKPAPGSPASLPLSGAVSMILSAA